MTSIKFKGVLAGLAAVAVVGAAVAQGNPPNPAVKDPATGAGQQSTQGTSMGATGTPAPSGTALGAGSTTGSTGGTTAGSASSGSSLSSDTRSSTTGSSLGGSSTMGASSSSDVSGSTGSRAARADRN
jgi:hypothetical protein